MSTAGTTQATGPVEQIQPEPVTLPETRRTGRARRRKRQRRRLQVLALRVLVAAAVLFGAVGLFRSIGDDGGDDGGKAHRGAAGRAPVVPPVLLAQQDDTGRAVSLTVLVPGEKARGGTLLLIPPGTMTEVVALGLEPVGRSLDLGGPGRLQATVENLLGASLGGVAVMDDEAVAAMLAPVGPLTVRLSQPVEEVDAGGRVEVLFQAGPNRIEPADAARFLASKGRGNDLERLARHQAFWDAWLDALRDRPAIAPTQPAALARVFTAFTSGDVRTRLVPVEAFGTSPEDGELYKVRGAELTRMVATSFPASATSAAAGGRPRVQILNGTGAIGLADAVRNRLGAGFDVRLTGNAGSFDHATTEVVFYDRKKQAMAEKVRRGLGVGRLVFSRRPLDVVDVTIVVGKDFQP